ncbi:MAG: hypothetical protein ACTSRC_21300 [Candidatus Helarchaeota archaeon]
MTQEDRKVKIQFTFPDAEPVQYLLSEADAVELECYAITSVHKRLIRRILRVSRNLIGKNEVTMSFILENSGSRSGDIYNALKYLKYHDIVEIQKDTRIITVLNQEKLRNHVVRIQELRSYYPHPMR